MFHKKNINKDISYQKHFKVITIQLKERIFIKIIRKIKQLINKRI